MDDIKYKIAKIKIEPGDVLVVKFLGPRRMSPQEYDYLKENFKSVFPGVRAMILDHDVELSILTRADIEARI